MHDDGKTSWDNRAIFHRVMPPNLTICARLSQENRTTLTRRQTQIELVVRREKYFEHVQNLYRRVYDGFIVVRR